MRTPDAPKGPPKKGVALSIVFHTLIILLVLFVAAREDMLGEKFKKIAVVIVPKKKEPEKPKEEKKPEPPKIAEPKKEEAKPVVKEASVKQVDTAKAPPTLVPQNVPDAAVRADFQIPSSSPVATTTDPIEAYQGLVQYEFETSWSYPRGLKDMGLIAEVDVNVDPKGVVMFKGWKQRSNNKEWDDSVEKVFQKPRTMRRQPPGGFPGQVTVRFYMDATHDEIKLN